MPLTLGEIITAFERKIPLSYQEQWDISGLQIGSRSQQVKSVLFALDICHEVIEAAIKKKVDLIVTHHPLHLKNFKNIDLDTYEGQIIYKAIKNKIAIYTAHTNHDYSNYSLSRHYAENLDLDQIKTIRPLDIPPYNKLVVFVPVEHSENVLQAIFKEGGGGVGAYSCCSFRQPGTGTYKGDETTNPFIGKAGQLEEVTENRIEVLVEKTKINQVVDAMIKAHPYEEVAYDIIESRNTFSDLGLGVMGITKQAKQASSWLPLIKKIFKLKQLKFIGDLKRPIQSIGICTGSGSSLLSDAIHQNIDLFITSDVKYHTALEVKRNEICVVDVGHFYSEIENTSILKSLFKKWFGNQLTLNEYKGLKDPFIVF